MPLTTKGQQHATTRRSLRVHGKGVVQHGPCPLSFLASRFRLFSGPYHAVLTDICASSCTSLLDFVPHFTQTDAVFSRLPAKRHKNRCDQPRSALLLSELIILLAHKLKVKVTAEGIETAKHWECLPRVRLRRGPRVVLLPTRRAGGGPPSSKRAGRHLPHASKVEHDQ